MPGCRAPLLAYSLCFAQRLAIMHKAHAQLHAAETHSQYEANRETAMPAGARDDAGRSTQRRRGPKWKGLQKEHREANCNRLTTDSMQFRASSIRRQNRWPARPLCFQSFQARPLSARTPQVL